MIVQVAKKSESPGKLPEKATTSAAGADLIVARVMKRSLFKITYGFGICLAIPEGNFGDVRPRSSIRDRYLILSNSCGVIDSDYRGEVMATFYKVPFLSKPYKVGERALQLIISKATKVDYIRTSYLGKTDRGSGGFGSTGK